MTVTMRVNFYVVGVDIPDTFLFNFFRKGENNVIDALKSLDAHRTKLYLLEAKYKIFRFHGFYANF